MTQTEEETAQLSNLLDIAKNAPHADRPVALRNLAEALTEKDPFTVSMYAEQVTACGLCNKSDFVQVVREVQNAHRSQSHNGYFTKPTDDELADRWITKHQLTAFGLGDYRRYKDGIWPIVDPDIIKQEILGELDQTKECGIRPTARLLNSVEEIARVKISVPNVKWDNQKDNLPCLNGVLSIHYRTLRQHSPEWYFTSKLGYDYDPTADCPNFKYVVRDTIPEAANFLQEYAGYSLTPDTSREIAVWFYGPPASGKSSILIGLQTMLGTRAGILGIADLERSRFALTNLIGKTLVISTEQPFLYFKATHTLNAIISGETIEVDRKFRDPVQIEPHAKLCWAMNETPLIKDPSNGLYRRIKVIQFPPIEQWKINPVYKEAIRDEGAGILNWALEGLDRLEKRGFFEFPECVQNATAEFKLANDVPGMFVTDKCLVGKDNKVQSSILYQAYRTWCLNNGHEPQSTTTLAKDWRRLGFQQYEADGCRWWRGVGLKPK